MESVAGWMIVAAIVGLFVWAIMRGRKGYVNVQTLMAQVEAHATADARAAAVAQNAVHVQVGREGVSAVSELQAAMRVVEAHGLAVEYPKGRHLASVDSGVDWSGQRAVPESDFADVGQWFGVDDEQ